MAVPLQGATQADLCFQTNDVGSILDLLVFDHAAQPLNQKVVGGTPST